MEALEATVETMATAAQATAAACRVLATEGPCALRSLAATVAMVVEFRSHPHQSIGALQATLAPMVSVSTRHVATTQMIPVVECTEPEAMKPRGFQATWTTDAA